MALAGAMPGTGRGLGDEANQGRPQVALQMMFGRGARPSGINFGGAPPQQVFGAPQYRVPAALANIITNLVFLKASSLVKVGLMAIFLWEASPIVMVL